VHDLSFNFGFSFGFQNYETLVKKGDAESGSEKFIPDPNPSPCLRPAIIKRQCNTLFWNRYSIVQHEISTKVFVPL
jgi:hypothetical protein